MGKDGGAARAAGRPSASCSGTSRQVLPDDLQKVTDIARSMVARYGMSERLGHVAYERDRRTFLGEPGTASREHGDETRGAIDEEVRWLVDEAMARVTDLLERHRDALERTSRALLDKETLEEAEFLAADAGD